MRKRLLPGLLFAALLPLSGARATKPCSRDSWFGNQQRTAKEWEAAVRWVAVGRISRIEHDPRPYANCASSDPSACARFNHARITLVVERMEKGPLPPGGRFELAARYCTKPIPTDLDTGRSYRFYGDQPDGFVTWEQIDHRPAGLRPWRSSSSSMVLGQSSWSRRARLRSESSLPPVWQRGQ